jgi:hypothetical protein
MAAFTKRAASPEAEAAEEKDDDDKTTEVEVGVHSVDRLSSS